MTCDLKAMFSEFLNARLSSLNPKLVTSRYYVNWATKQILHPNTNSTMLNTLRQQKKNTKTNITIYYILSTINYQLLSPKVLKPTRDSPFPTADFFVFLTPPKIPGGWHSSPRPRLSSCSHNCLQPAGSVLNGPVDLLGLKGSDILRR